MLFNELPTTKTLEMIYLLLGCEVCAIWWAQPRRSPARAYQLSWLQQDLNSLSQRRTSLNPIHILAAYVQSRSLEMPRRLELRRFPETNARRKIHSKNWFTGFTCEVEVSDGVCYVENSRQFGLSFQKTFFLIYLWEIYWNFVEIYLD